MIAIKDRSKGPGGAVLGTTLDVEVVLVISGVIEGVIEVEGVLVISGVIEGVIEGVLVINGVIEGVIEVVLVRVVLSCGVVVSSDGVTLEREEVNDGNDVGENVVVGNVVIEGVLADIGEDTIEEAVNDEEGTGVEDAMVIFTTDVDILALVVTSTVKETILEVVTSMDDILVDILDIIVLVLGSGGVVVIEVIEVVNIEELSPDPLTNPLSPSLL